LGDLVLTKKGREENGEPSCNRGGASRRGGEDCRISRIDPQPAKRAYILSPSIREDGVKKKTGGDLNFSKEISRKKGINSRFCGRKRNQQWQEKKKGNKGD